MRYQTALHPVDLFACTRALRATSPQKILNLLRRQSQAGYIALTNSSVPVPLYCLHVENTLFPLAESSRLHRIDLLFNFQPVPFYTTVNKILNQAFYFYYFYDIKYT